MPAADRALVVASATRPLEAGELRELAGHVDVLELRADRAGDVPAAALREHFSGRLLYTLRSAAEGGAGEDAPAPRRVRLAWAVASGYDLVDLEARRDLHPDLLAALAPERRLLSWHGGPCGLPELTAQAERMREVPAAYTKLVTRAEAHGQELPPLALLQALARRDVIAFAAGEIGGWTRLLAPRLGAPVVFAAVDEPASPGQPPLARLRDDYGLPELPPLRFVCGVVGQPVEHSLSPRLHNRAYREAGVEALYLPFHVEHFGDFWLEVVESGVLGDLGFPLRGLSVTSPYKATALALAGASSPLAGYVGSANTLIARDGVWEAESTDGEGVLGPLVRRRIAVDGRRAAVLGAGAAGRAAAVALARAGAQVMLVNRSRDRLERAVAELRLPGHTWEDFDPGAYALVVHATPLGRRAEDPLPLAPERLAPDATVVDLTYLRDGPTPLVRAVRAAGRRAIDGREVLLHQAVPQFELMTGRPMPLELARQLLPAAAED
jgi:3-dehydroquinate dehydratase/shikimate dehydrogenase